MPTEDTALTVAPAVNTGLATALHGIKAHIHRAAEANVQLAVQEYGEIFEQAELDAMLAIDELKQINGLDLAAVLLRGEKLAEIEARGHVANHPAGYTNFRDMAKRQGIGISELSNVRDLYNIIFPFLTEQLELNLALVWEEIGYSNFRELIPVAKAIITGEEPNRQATRESVAAVRLAVLQDADQAEPLLPTGALAFDLGDEVEFRLGAVLWLLKMAEGTTQELREALRPWLAQLPDEAEAEPIVLDPDEVADVDEDEGDTFTVTVGRRRTRRQVQVDRLVFDAVVDPDTGRQYLIANVNDQQYDAFQRRVRHIARTRTHRLPRDPRARQEEATRIDTLRGLAQLLEV